MPSDSSGLIVWVGNGAVGRANRPLCRLSHYQGTTSARREPRPSGGTRRFKADGTLGCGETAEQGAEYGRFGEAQENGRQAGRAPDDLQKETACNGKGGEAR